MRAYSPRLATVQLANDLRAVPGIERVRIVAPTHGADPKPARLLVDFTNPTVAAALGAIGTPSGFGRRVLSMTDARHVIAANEVRKIVGS